MTTETVQIRGLDGVLELLKSLPPELVFRRGGVVLSGLRRGGNVIRKAWRAEIQRILDEPNIGGVYYSTGTLSKSVKVTRLRNPRRIGADEAVRVSVPSRAKYPDGTRVALVAGVLEFGTEKMEAKAPIRKAFDASKHEALAAVVAGINAGLERAIKKLEARTAKL